MFIVGGVLEVIYGAIRRGETESLPDLEEDLTRLAFRSYLHPGEWQRVAQRGAQA
jgi:hypothetical protein